MYFETVMTTYLYQVVVHNICPKYAIGFDKFMLEMFQKSSCYKDANKNVMYFETVMTTYLY